jgi:S-layer homology domain
MKKFILGTVFGALLTISSVALASHGNVFQDIAADSWYTDEANSLYHKGIFTGYMEGSNLYFKPDDSINRAETAAVLDRMLEYVEYNYEPFPRGEEIDGETNYYVCQETETQDRIYQERRCGDDTCWSTFYDYKGELLEETGEYGMEDPGDQDPVETDVENCIATTDAYFDQKIAD